MVDENKEVAKTPTHSFDQILSLTEFSAADFGLIKNIDDCLIVFRACAQYGRIATLKGTVRTLIEYYEQCFEKNLREKPFSFGAVIDTISWSSDRTRVSVQGEVFSISRPVLDTLNKAIDVEKKLSLLHIAAKYGQDEIIRFLLSLTKGSLDKLDSEGRTPLSLAALAGKEQAVNLLLTAGASLDPLFGVAKPPLHFAVLGGAVEVVRKIYLKNPIYLNYADDYCFTPVHYAAYLGNEPVLRYLVGRGAKVNAVDIYKELIIRKMRRYSLLMLAAQGGHLSCVKYLLEECKPNINEANHEGYTAIDFALEGGKISIAAILLQHGAYAEGPRTLGLLWDLTKTEPDVFKILSMGHSAEHYEYALMCIMSSHRHSSYLGPLKKQDKEFKKHTSREQYLLDKGWQPLKTSEEYGITQHGYFGVAYYKVRDEGIEIVVAHRGTCFSETGNLVADKEILEREKPKILKEAVSPYEQTLIADFKKTQHSKKITRITHTGFSLGGFIAGACVALTKNTRVYACTFDAPGIDFLDYDRADISKEKRIVNYVIEPNLVNTANKHLGPVRKLCLDLGLPQQKPVDKFLDIVNFSALDQLFNTQYSHNLDRFLSICDKTRNLFYRKVNHWPYAINTTRYSSTPPRSKKEMYGIGGDGYGVFLVNLGLAIFQAGAIELAQAVWERTQTKEGKGFIGVWHKRSNTVDYHQPRILSPLEEPDDSIQRQLSKDDFKQIENQGSIVPMEVDVADDRGLSLEESSEASPRKGLKKAKRSSEVPEKPNNFSTSSSFITGLLGKPPIQDRKESKPQVLLKERNGRPIMGIHSSSSTGSSNLPLYNINNTSTFLGSSNNSSNRVSSSFSGSSFDPAEEPAISGPGGLLLDERPEQENEENWDSSTTKAPGD